MKRKLTPKQRVLKKYPASFSAPILSRTFVIINGARGTDISVYKDTPREAWADAARRLG